MWQIYLDNANPVLKITHVPTLQAEIIEAAGNIQQIELNLQALMFSIYCTAIMTLTDQQCQSQFSSNRSDLLTGYQMGCQQALVDCDFLATSSIHCLTAIYHFMVN